MKKFWHQESRLLQNLTLQVCVSFVHSPLPMAFLPMDFILHSSTTLAEALHSLFPFLLTMYNLDLLRTSSFEIYLCMMGGCLTGTHGRVPAQQVTFPPPANQLSVTDFRNTAFCQCRTWKGFQRFNWIRHLWGLEGNPFVRKLVLYIPRWL